MALLKLLPKASLSRAVGAATRLPAPASLHRVATQVFSKAYAVDLSEAERPREDYPTFAQFFTRRLKDGARPLEGGEDTVISPVDGAVSEVGIATGGRLVQAKGLDYTLAALLGDPERAERFIGGAFATLYLSPRDYHRVHVPLTGRITGYVYVPGSFWPVNPASVRNVPHLFASNERLVTFLETALGQVAVVMVGATCVGRIRASYDDIVTHEGRAGQRVTYAAAQPMARGEELGMFEMGSTVILAFQPGKVRLDASLVPGAKVRMGQAIGRRESAK